MRAVVVAGVALALAGVGLNPATADRERELEQRSDALSGDIHQQHSELEHSSRRLQEATAALHASQRRLSDAQDKLAGTLGRLAAAQQLDQQMQLALVDAEDRLQVAEEELARASALVDKTQAGIERFAVQSYTTSTPGLISVDAMLNGDSPMAFPELMSSAESVVVAQTATMDDLDAARIFMALREQRVQELRDEVALKRAEAAANLVRKQQLTANARTSRQTVEKLVAQRRRAHAEAADARQRDLRILQGMEREQERVHDLLTQLRVRQSTPVPTASADDGGGILGIPIPGAYVTSPYGMRMHPVLRIMKLHDGTDFGAACGTPIRAAADGTVVEQYFNAGYGNRVIISHGTVNGTALATSYNHMTSFATSVGQTVQRGEVVGYVGTTGYSTGCHLHFMVYENGVPVDPAGWL